MTGLDITDPNSDGFVFNSEVIEKQGAWGLFHEIGHNRQQDWWSKYSILSRLYESECSFPHSI